MQGAAARWFARRALQWCSKQPRLADLGKNLVLFGAVLPAAGAVLQLMGRLGLGRIRGDIVGRRGGATLYFPMVTSLLLSLLLTTVLNLVLRRR